MKVKSLSRARLLATPWTAAYQAPPSIGFSRQECWSGVPLLSPPDSSGIILLQQELASLSAIRLETGLIHWSYAVKLTPLGLGYFIRAELSSLHLALLGPHCSLELISMRSTAD